MLREYQLKNFKAFPDTKALPIRPITLLYGPNSAGKSSIIQSLLLLKQSLEEEINSDSALLTKGSFTDVGSYYDLIYMHEKSRNLSFKFSFEIDKDELKLSNPEMGESDLTLKTQKSLYETLLVSPYVSIEIEFNQPTSTSEISLIEVKLWAGSEGKELITLRHDEERNELAISRLNDKNSFWRDWWKEHKKVIDNSFRRQVRKTLEARGIEFSARLRNIKKVHSELKNLENDLKDKNSESRMNFEKLCSNLEDLENQKSSIQEKQTAIKAKYDENSRAIRNEIVRAEKIRQEDIEELLDNEENIPEEWSDKSRSIFAELTTMWSIYKKEKDPLEEKIRPIVGKVRELEKNKYDKEYKIEENKTKLGLVEVLLGIYNDLYEEAWHKSPYFSLEHYLKICSYISLEIDKFILERIEYPFEDMEYNHDENDLPENISILFDIYDGYSTLKLIEGVILHGSDLIRDFLNRLTYIGPFRDYPERFYISNNQSSNKVGKTGKGMPDLLHQASNLPRSDLLDKVNEVIKEFDIGYKIEIATFEDKKNQKESDIYALRLVDESTGVSVSPLDLGFGVSQILPVIVQSISSPNQILIIEQPEVHLHPRLQTKLGELISRSVKELNNQFIIETHSEHLMLRLQRLIREGKLDSTDVSVLYVDKNAEGSRIYNLEIDEEGDFVDEWPSGFFEEDFEEIFS